jgi:hypothetical protein
MKTVFLTMLGAGLLAGCAQHGTPAGTLQPVRSAYFRPLVSPGTLFASLPAAVQRTVRAETGGTAIEEVVKDRSSGRLIYRIYFENSVLYPPLYVAPDGSVLNPDNSIAVGAPGDSLGVLTGGRAAGLTLDDLPPKVIKAIQQYAPHSEIQSVTKETRGDQVTYEIVFKDSSQPRLYLGPDGTVLSQSAQSH